MFVEEKVILFDTEDDIYKTLNNFIQSNEKLERGICRGVTSILSATSDKSGIEKWIERVGEEEANRIIKESQKIGNSLDKMIIQYYNSPHEADESYYLLKQIQPCLKKIKPIALQMKLWSKKYKMMGYLDCLGYYKGELTLIDFKNTRRVKQPEHYHDYLLQCIYIVYYYI